MNDNNDNFMAREVVGLLDRTYEDQEFIKLIERKTRALRCKLPPVSRPDIRYVISVTTCDGRWVVEARLAESAHAPLPLPLDDISTLPVSQAMREISTNFPTRLQEGYSLCLKQESSRSSLPDDQIGLLNYMRRFAETANAAGIAQIETASGQLRMVFEKNSTAETQEVLIEGMVTRIERGSIRLEQVMVYVASNGQAEFFKQAEVLTGTASAASVSRAYAIALTNLECHGKRICLAARRVLGPRSSRETQRCELLEALEPDDDAASVLDPYGSARNSAEGDDRDGQLCVHYVVRREGEGFVARGLEIAWEATGSTADEAIERLRQRIQQCVVDRSESIPVDPSVFEVGEIRLHV